jgi:hypothetical protein
VQDLREGASRSEWNADGMFVEDIRAMMVATVVWLIEGLSLRKVSAA